MLQKFEKQLGEYFCLSSGIKPVCVNNATTGLIIAIKSLDLPAGSKVLVPSMTFAASVLAIKECGLVPAYVDVDESDLCMWAPKDADLKNVSAIMPVCVYGNTLSSGVINFGLKNKLKIIVDAAGAIGTQMPLSNIDATVYSFHATKTLPVGEGGCIVFKTKELEDGARRLIDFGFNSNRECSEYGINGKMSEIEAVIGIQSLKRLPDVLFKRRMVRNEYRYIFKDYIDSGLLKIQSGYGLQLFTIICKDKEFKSLLEYHLNSNGIETRVYYKPCHKNGILAQKTTLENTEDLEDRILSLPLYSSLSVKELKYIYKVMSNWNIY
jgi:dTDP-4-amino-4,6-dideoxygalactose transaminase